ncbi:unnamed protein product, partial [Onchocerca flexuosa]|uniref:Uncharacterized protein n=1 Tax=Onchocerca flexuosa TaxID=387005 RepID=A0A183HQL2_9BILA
MIAAIPHPINIAPKMCAPCVGGIHVDIDDDDDDDDD